MPGRGISAISTVSTHSRPKAADHRQVLTASSAQFQHTAARRRLTIKRRSFDSIGIVSTHSRPKAAVIRPTKHRLFAKFQHTAARRRLGDFQ